MDLASFYRRRKRYDDMVAAIHTGASLDPNHGPALVDGAANLIQANLEPQTAIQLLQQYLNSQAQSEDSPAFAVRAKLAQLLVDQGDSAAPRNKLPPRVRSPPAIAFPPRVMRRPQAYDSTLRTMPIPERLLP